MTRRLAGTGFWILLALLVIANAIVMWHSLTVLRFWEDEAFNLTVPRNLLAGLGYTSDGTLSGSHLTPFDPRISTGPTVLLPVAGVLALGADPVIGARLVPLAYWVLLLVGLAVLGRRLAGRWGALVAVALPLAFNTAEGVSPIQGPADLLGEIAAAALVVWAMIVLPRRAWLAGLLLGLAVQAKLIALLALPAFAVALFLLAPRGRFGPSLLATLRRSIVPLVMVAVPTLLMELAALVTLGFSGYEVHARLMKEFVLSGGQKGAPTTIGEKLQTLAGSWFLPWWLVSVAAVLAVVVIVLAARRGRGADPEHAAEASARSDSADADPTAVRDAASAPTAAALDTAALDTAGGDRGPVRGADPRDAASASAPAGLGTDTEGGDRGPVRGADPRDAASASAPAGLGTDTASAETVSSDRPHWWDRDPQLLAMAFGSAVGLLAFVGWWAQAAQLPLWVRHPSVGVFAFAPILAAVAVRAVAALWRRRSTSGGRRVLVRAFAGASAALLAVVALGGAASDAARALQPPTAQTLTQQLADAAPIAAWVRENDVEWLAAKPWGWPVSAVVLSGAHVGLFDAPAMARIPTLGPDPCGSGSALVSTPGTKVCPAP